MDLYAFLAYRRGPHALTAVATDAAGNTSGVSNTWTLTIDSVAPAAPVITQVLDDVPERLGALNPNDSTNDTKPTLNGTAEPGSSVTIRLDGTDLSRSWSTTTARGPIPSPRLLAAGLIPLPLLPPMRRVTPASRQVASP